MGDCSSRPVSAMLAALIVFGALSNGSAYGQSEPASLRLDEAIERALAANAGLRAAGLNVDIERARREAAALATPFVIGAELENFAGSDSLGSFDATESTLQLSRVLERGNKRLLRSELGDTRVALAESERMLARLDLAAEVTRRFIRVVVDQQRLLLAEQAIEVATETREIVNRRVDIGRSSEAELATAEIELAQAELELAALASRLESDRVSLVTLWADTRADFGSAEAELFDLPAVATFDAMQQRIAASPDLLRLVSEQRILEAEQRLAEARQSADLSVGLGLRHLAAPSDTAFMVSVSVPVGSRTRAGPTIAEAAARRERVPELIEQRRLDLHAVLYGLYEETVVIRDRYRTLSETLLPRGERAVELYRQGFELGSYSLLELNAAQRELLALRRSALTAAADFHQILVDIEQLLGGIDPTGERR